MLRHWADVLVSKLAVVPDTRVPRPVQDPSLVTKRSTTHFSPFSPGITYFTAIMDAFLSNRTSPKRGLEAVKVPPGLAPSLSTRWS